MPNPEVIESLKRVIQAYADRMPESIVTWLVSRDAPLDRWEEAASAWEQGGYWDSGEGFACGEAPPLKQTPAPAPAAPPWQAALEAWAEALEGPGARDPSELAEAIEGTGSETESAPDAPAAAGLYRLDGPGKPFVPIDFPKSPRDASPASPADQSSREA